jgi:hypothetical protein
MSRKISANRFLGVAISAIWRAIWRPWLITFAPIWISLIAMRYAASKPELYGKVGDDGMRQAA